MAAIARPVRRLWKINRSICQKWTDVLKMRGLHSTSARCQYPADQRETEKKEDINKTVLDFFNNCDYITLKKLKYQNRIFNKVEPSEILRRGIVSMRYKNINSLKQDIGGFKVVGAVGKVAEQIQLLKENEEKTLGIKYLVPQLYSEDVKDIDQVTAVEVFQNEIAWAVETRDRTIVSTGHAILFPQFKYTYEHVAYHDRLAEVISTIPESPIYLMCPPYVGSGDKFINHQNIVLNLAILLLNMKSATRNLHGDCDDHLSSGNGVQDIPNYVHTMKLDSVQEFYDILFQKELLHHAWDFNHWVQVKTRPLSGLKWDKLTEESLTKAVGRQQMTKCVLIADMFCKCLHKSVDNFPRMFSYTQ